MIIDPPELAPLGGGKNVRRKKSYMFYIMMDREAALVLLGGLLL